MTPDTIAALVNLGSAGAVIGMCIVFLNFIAKRDAEWRSFFTMLLEGNKENRDEITGVLKELVTMFRTHDSKTDQAIATMHERTRPRGETK